jgi:hypothetical protein
LEQAGYDAEAVVANRCGFRLKLYVSGIRQIGARLPGSLLSFAGQFGQMLALLVVDPIEVA